MRSILNKIFSRKLGIGVFLISGFAFFLGLSLVLLSVQSYVKINQYISPKKSASDYIILNKEVGIGHTIFGGKAEFNREDVEDLKKQPFVQDLGEFSSNQFQAKAYAGDELGFQTELFFESVPDQFIDDKPYNFRWSEGSEVLPIIVSQEFLNLYNFGFALGRGTPQLSKSTIGLFTLRVDIEGPKGRRTYNAKIVGFSERIPSVLVPKDFLNWANANIGSAKSDHVSRVIIKVRSDKAGTMEKYFEEHGLKVSQEKIKFSNIVSIVNVVMSILVFFGVAFIFYSLVIVVLNFSLMIADAKDEISLLQQLGYKTKYLIRHMSVYLTVFVFVVAVLSFVTFYIGNTFLIGFLSKKGIELTKTIEPQVWMLGAGFILLSFFVALIFIFRVLRKHS